MSFAGVLEWISLVIGAIGAGVISFGVLVGVADLIRTEAWRLTGKDVQDRQAELRHRVGYYLLLGLEFLLAADIVETIGAPSLEHLALLGGIVLIRTVISWSLSWELSAFREAQQGDQ